MLNFGQSLSPETKQLISVSRLGQTASAETRLKISVNNGRSVGIVVYENGVPVMEFNSIAACAEHFFNDQSKRAPIRYALAKGTTYLFMGKYHLIKK